MADRRLRSEDETFIVQMDSYEGPIDALLDLARSQKVDLDAIDLIRLIDQFEAVIARAMALRIELAADWLVMATWLAYLKSKKLIASPKGERDEPDADALALHLKRLDALKTACDSICARRQVGIDWFSSGMSPAPVGQSRNAGSLHQLLAAYNVAVSRPTNETAPNAPLKPFDIASVSDAISLLAESAEAADWINLLKLVPGSGDELRLRSNIAAHLVAALEMARNGRLEFRQDRDRDPVMVKVTLGSAAS